MSQPWTSYRHLLPVALVALGCSSTSGSNGEIPFHADVDLLQSFEWDSGFVPSSSDAQVRVVVRGDGGATVDARGSAASGELTPVAESGRLALQGGLTLEVHAKVNVASIDYEGIVQEVGYTVPLEDIAFDPFLLADGESATLSTALPEEELLRAPIPSVPGGTLVLTVTGGEIITTFTGTCAALRDGNAQFLGDLTIGGTVELAATIEVEIPVVGTRSFGPLTVTVPLRDLERPVDLGLFDASSGTRLESGASPCAPDSWTSDGGLGDGGTPTGDGGDFVPMGDAGPEQCVATRAPPETGQVCDYATAECLSTAPSWDDFEQCIDADGAPDLCRECIYDEVRSCFQTECADLYQTLGCCAREHCAELTDPERQQSCLDAFCPDELSAYRACTSETTCGISGVCFRLPPGGT